MARRADQPRTHLADLFGDRPGWRLEPRTTPGASPLWCYVDAGQIELSVTAERDGVHLFVMDDDRELLFGDAKGSRRGCGRTKASPSTRPLPLPPARSGSASSSSGAEPDRRRWPRPGSFARPSVGPSVRRAGSARARRFYCPGNDGVVLLVDSGCRTAHSCAYHKRLVLRGSGVTPPIVRLHASAAGSA